MRALSLLLAAFWSVQALVCLPVEFGDRVEGHFSKPPGSVLGHVHEGEHAAHYTDSGLAPGSASHSAPSQSGSEHHPNSDGQCERHCASLDQSIPATSPSVLALDSACVALISTDMFEIVSLRSIGRKVEAFEIGLPPPDLLALLGALRV